MADSIGEILKNTREEKTLGFEDVQRSTKIHIPILKALEEDRILQEMNLTYAKGFVKKYADFLGLNGRELAQRLSSFSDAHEEKEDGGLGFVGMNDKERAQKDNLKNSVVYFAIFVLAAVGILFVAWIVFDVAKDLRGRPARNVSVSVRTRAPSRAQENPAPERSAVTVPLKAPIRHGQRLSLTIVAEKDCWVQLDADGSRIYVGVLKAGTRETWEAKDNFILRAGNARGIKLYLNKNPLGSPGSGVVKDVLVNRNGMTLGKK